MFIIKKYIIKGKSMSPTLNPGDIVLASSLPYLFRGPNINEVIVCWEPRSRKILVKRIIKLDKDAYFITGDNPEESTDSNSFGPIMRRDIIGKVIFVL